MFNLLIISAEKDEVFIILNISNNTKSLPKKNSLE